MEIWKDIEGFEGHYQISNYGRVKSLARRTGAAHECNLEDKILSPIEKREKGQKQGYLFVNLFKKNKGTLSYVHRLVAQAFIDNPENKKTVNHKDGNKHNNHVDNLEWNTNKENNMHAIKTGLRTVESFRAPRKNNTPIWQYDKDMNLIAVYPSLREAERQTHVNNKGITEGIKKGWKFGGFIWRREPA